MVAETGWKRELRRNVEIGHVDEEHHLTQAVLIVKDHFMRNCPKLREGNNQGVSDDGSSKEKLDKGEMKKLCLLMIIQSALSKIM